MLLMEILFPQRTECHVHNANMTGTARLSIIPMSLVALYWYLHPVPSQTLYTAYKKLALTRNP